jgi:hypothetical protein
MVEAHIHCRVAAADDAAGIFRVLAEVAPEIPLLMDTGERREGISRIIDKCISTGESWVTTDGGGVVTASFWSGRTRWRDFSMTIRRSICVTLVSPTPAADKASSAR